jgi:hypothetical protein
MPMSKDDVQREHEDALARMDEAQLRALARINRAFRESRFANCSAKDAMGQVFEEEAKERSAKADASPSADQARD